ncbi:conserved hypothetical protein [Arcobacter nitrofigilis DSM 7299]|uniref:Uncharacterized protein n=1 Tax=Arcobacter nitrofigilis (strain ATCC 33309 / DSM 7299 / CCUG 15893 / LMG 7604 / NCTC 12251 / CI) TaxID=572480 RepID=D5UZW2_ARCNC|nr:hypothetical protein [Arcobacter nitrofigilis]ADG93331.1 conserved hypothetical protein [Arcobacter nitrofigilis DSM 7299]
MIILGDNLVPFEETSFIKELEDITNTKANSTILFDFNESLLKYSYDNNLFTGVIVHTIKEALYANALHAKYIICDKPLDKTIQDIAENYMFDSKVLTIIESSNELEIVAMNKIDGAIYKNLLG